MNNESQRLYTEHDSSSVCALGASFASRISPIGTCIHTTAGISSKVWLCEGSVKAGRAASADYLIDHDGTRHKLCRPGRRPYHAGQASYTIHGHKYEGDALSEILLGVELEQMGEQLCTPEQLDSTAELVVSCGLTYGWRWPYFIVGHYEIARPLGRRSDPQGFDWGDFLGRLYIRATMQAVPGL